MVRTVIDNQVNKDQIKSHRDRVLIEIAGPAGSGKTTLARMMIQSNSRTVLGETLQLRKPDHLSIFLPNAASLVPLVLSPAAGRAYSWDEFKSMVYLNAWPKLLKKQAGEADLILLDHGPVFRMAMLNAFGPPRLQEHSAKPWWKAMFQQWAKRLDFVVWLDAPDSVLQQRIDYRERDHAVKGQSIRDVTEFLRRYRESYHYILECLQKESELAILSFDSSKTTLDQMEKQILLQCSQARKEIVA